jgi:glycosyltransferase involved in cell wall biosynthesis
MVFDFQGSLTSEMIDHGFLQAGTPSFRVFRRAEGWVVDHADAIVTSTHHGADVLVRDFGCPAARITVVPDAVNTDRFRPVSESDDPGAGPRRVQALRQELGISEGRPVVLYLGLLAEYQGITHLLRAAQALVQAGSEAHFLVMGFPGEDRYRKLAAQLGIGDRVTFTGAIPYEQAPAYLALGTLAVSPKLSLTEGNGKLLNYIAMGLATVAYDTPVSREILGSLGIYAPCGDWRALARELDRALRDPIGLEQRGRALRLKALASHTWQRSVGPLLDVYARLLG